MIYLGFSPSTKLIGEVKRSINGRNGGEAERRRDDGCDGGVLISGIVSEIPDAAEIETRTVYDEDRANGKM
jgi:hypothetical protein